MNPQTKKLIFAGIVAILIIAAFYFYSDSMTINEIILAVVGAAGYIKYVWVWIDKKEVEKDFHREAGIKYSTFKKIIKPHK